MEETEIWKDVEGYEGLYQVSNFGRVKSLNYRGLGKEKVLKQGKHKQGYLLVHLYKDNKQKTSTVHKLVALAFLENPYNFPQVNHKDENKENNKVENLEFCSARYNINYGTRSERVSEKRKGFRFTKEAIQKMSDSHKGKKLPIEVVNKIREKNSKTVIQYSLDGTFIKEWKSVIQASRELKISQGHISECCNNKRKSSGGFIWRYKM